jgi:hypothetical protein
MSDHFSETTSTGWFSRIGSSITGMLVGLVLLLVSAGVLWWNEGRSVATAKGLAEGAKVTLEADAGAVDPGKEGKLVHLTGKTTLTGPAEDPLFGVRGPDLVKLQREVEVFQWVEDKKQTTRKKFGGGEETVTEYTYQKKWDDELHDSSRFHHPDGHQNVQAKVERKTFQAANVSLGAYRLPAFLLSQWNDFQPHPLPPVDSLKGDLAKAIVQDDWLVLSKTPTEPAVGDTRVKFESMKPGEVSILARQIGDTFEEYRTKQDTTIGRLMSGAQSKEAMYAAAESENTFLTWMFRLGGFIAMFIGFSSLLRPLKVLADFFPWVGNVVGAGTGLVAFLISLAGSFTIIAIAWIFYRPLLGVSLLVVAAAGLYFLMKSLKPKVA